MTPEASFLSRVLIDTNTDGCWEWCAGRDQKGYGRLKARGLPRLAHRAAWVVLVGPIPDGGHVLHRCDNPPCCNPAHLFIGDNAANVADRVAKGRTVAPRGEGSPQAKLTDAAVLSIREACAAGASLRDVAARFSISEALVSHVRRRVGWAHVGGPASSRSLVVSPGQRYGRLTTIAPDGFRVYGARRLRYAMWRVVCDCGSARTVRADSLRHGETRSCGCIRAEMLRARNRRAS